MASGWAPTNSSMISPFLKSFTDGIDMIPYFADVFGALSVSIFAITSLFSYSFAILFNIGPSILQGPHHSAQKSARTGFVFDFSITSFSNVSSVTLICIL